MVWASLHKHVLVAGLSVFAATSVWAASPSDDTPEFARETEALVAATASWFEQVEATLSDDGARPLTLRPAPTPASASTDTVEAEAFSTDRPVRHLTGYRITWYPVDTLLGSVDFMGTWDNAKNLVCGYVTWDLSNPDSPTLQSVTANYVDVSEIAKTDRAEREAYLLEANCAFGDIDENYAALN